MAKEGGEGGNGNQLGDVLPSGCCARSVGEMGPDKIVSFICSVYWFPSCFYYCCTTVHVFILIHLHELGHVEPSPTQSYYWFCVFLKDFISF